MRQDLYFDSCGWGKIHYCQWTPEGEVKAIVQIVHGIAEHVQRYDEFARWLNARGILVVAQDHMGHGMSVGDDGIQGYFHGGWFSAVEDCFTLMQMTMVANPGIPYFLFGHSMGSFMARTMLIRKPDCGIAGCIICGTAWQGKALIGAAVPMSKVICKMDGEKNPSPKLQGIMFGSYNKRIENVRTEFDWLTREDTIVDAYIADPMCGFVATAGLLRDMVSGIAYIQKRENLDKMNKDLPVLFVAGQEDPVGNYGKGVSLAAEKFKNIGMRQVSCKIYPEMRHEILNEIGKELVYEDAYDWIVSQSAGL